MRRDDDEEGCEGGGVGVRCGMARGVSVEADWRVGRGRGERRWEKVRVERERGRNYRDTGGEGREGGGICASIFSFLSFVQRNIKLLAKPLATNLAHSLSVRGREMGQNSPRGRR